MDETPIKEISLSEIEGTLKELLKDSPIPIVENLGGGLYRLPGGAITNIHGVCIFDEMLFKTIKNKFYESNSNDRP